MYMYVVVSNVLFEPLGLIAILCPIQQGSVLGAIILIYKFHFINTGVHLPKLRVVGGTGSEQSAKQYTVS